MGPRSFAPAITALAAATLAACYSPSPRSGSYLCADDGSCPTGLTCSACARVCVSRPSDDVCSLRLTLDSPPPCSPRVADACVTEGGDLRVVVTALDDAGAPSTYSGPGRIASSWGHARPQPRRDDDPESFRFERGSATLTVHLDRATPNNATAQLSARVGHVEGVGIESVIIDPRPFRNPEPSLAPGASSWATTFLGFAAVDRGPSGEYRMYVSGLGNPILERNVRARIGVATSMTGAAGSWAVGTNPVFSDDNKHLFAPTVLRLAGGGVRLFTTAYQVAPGGEATGPGSIWAASSSDGVSFGMLTKALDPATCPFCQAKGGMLYPWALHSPGDAGQWLLFFSTAPADASGTALGVGRTIDQGGTWHLSPVPAPSSGQAGAGIETAFSARVIFDARDGIYRMWYAENAEPNAMLFNPCKSNIGYATSEDGLFWAGSRNVALALGNVKWAPPNSVGLYPGAVLPADGGGWQLYFSPVVNLLGVCLPVGVGRATDS